MNGAAWRVTPVLRGGSRTLHKPLLAHGSRQASKSSWGGTRHAGLWGAGGGGNESSPVIRSRSTQKTAPQGHRRINLRSMDHAWGEPRGGITRMKKTIAKTRDGYVKTSHQSTPEALFGKGRWVREVGCGRYEWVLNGVRGGKPFYPRGGRRVDPTPSPALYWPRWSPAKPL